MTAAVIGFDEGQERLDWRGIASALEQGHSLERAKVSDTFIYRGDDTMLNRSAWIDGLGLAIKVATVFPGNAQHGRPSINGGVSLFDDETGALEAIIDFHLVTKWKTAGDSLLGALRLARPESRNVLIVGAGTVARNLYAAYSAGFPNAKFTFWNRTHERAQALADELGATATIDLEAAVRSADIVSSATMSTAPLIRGAWLQPGQHVDLIGAYRPDMREVDDTALERAQLFMDSRATVLGHIGEFKIPIEAGTLDPAKVVADFYDLDSGEFERKSADQITLFKNGGGAHLDLMTSRYILDRWNQA